MTKERIREIFIASENGQPPTQAEVEELCSLAEAALDDTKPLP